MVVVDRVDIYSVSEVKHGEDNIFLSCKMKGIETSVVGELIVDSPLLDKVADDIEMT